MAALPVKLRPTGRIHYSWVIIAILAVVQIFGQSISMSAGIMVPELRAPLEEGGRFGWPPAFIGFALAGYYLVGSLTSPFSGRFGDLLGPRKLIIAGGLLFGVSMVLIGFITSVWQFFIVYSVMLALTSSHLNGSPDGGGESVVPQAARPGDRDNVGCRRRGRRGAGSGLFDAAGEFWLDGDVRCHRFGWSGSDPGVDAVFSAMCRRIRACYPTAPPRTIRFRPNSILIWPSCGCEFSNGR